MDTNWRKEVKVSLFTDKILHVIGPNILSGPIADKNVQWIMWIQY